MENSQQIIRESSVIDIVYVGKNVDPVHSLLFFSFSLSLSLFADF